MMYPANYQWGSGMFRDIANIRRGVYTEYYVMIEHADTLREILGAVPENHCRRLLQEIEAPDFNIDRLNYEEIKAYLWRESLLEFGSEIQTWLHKKLETFRVAGQNQLRVFSNQLTFPLAGWRKAILLSAAMTFFDITTNLDYEVIIPRMAEAVDREANPEGLIVAIDFYDRLFCNVIQKPQRVVLLPGDISTLTVDLKLYGECLIEHWSKIHTGDPALFGVTLLVNENYCPRNNNKVIQRNATLADVEAALQFEGLDKLREYQKAGWFQVRSFSGEFSGAVPADLKVDGLKVLHEADYIIALGEQNNITLVDLPVNSFRVFAIRDFSTIFFTGIKNNPEEHKYPKLALLDVPAGIRPAIDYVPDLKSVLDAQQYFRLYRSIQAVTWDALIEKARLEYAGNMLEAAQRTDCLGAEEIQKAAPVLSHACGAARIAQTMLDDFQGVYRCLTKPLSEQVARVMHVLHYPQGVANKSGERLELGVTFANQLKNYRGSPKSLLTYDDIARNSPAALFGFNMLYFITRNLILKFNKANPHFDLSDSFFGEFIDFLNFPGEDGGYFYPSLYNKGAFGLKKDGTFEFGRVRLPDTGVVTIPIDGEAIPFRWTAVNPVHDFSEIISMFTPMEPGYLNPNLRAPHFVGSTRALHMLPENDNYNFVFINNILLGVVRGSTEIPPFGTVLSVPPALLSITVRKHIEKDMASTGKKRLVTKDTRVRFDFALDAQWRDCAWIMGGALLMVNQGKTESLDFEKDDSPGSVYCIEGWNLESSQRTQETPVETNLNEARMTVGLTNDDQFFMTVIEGRANNRTGATHVETVAWIREYFEAQNTQIRFALDLDSASSVSLGVFRAGDFLLLNQTARGSDSKLYDTRYYNHLGYLYKAEA